MLRALTNGRWMAALTLTLAASAQAALTSTYSNALNVHGRVDINADNTNEFNSTLPFSYQSNSSGVGQGQVYSAPSDPAGLFYGETKAQAVAVYNGGPGVTGLQALSQSKVQIQSPFSNSAGLEWSSDATAGLKIQGIRVAVTDPGLSTFIPVHIRFNFTMKLDGSFGRNTAANVFDGYAQTADVAVNYGDTSQTGHAFASQFGTQGLNLQKSGVLSSISSMDSTVTFSVEQEFIPAFGTTKDIEISVRSETYTSGVYGPVAGNGETAASMLTDLSFYIDSYKFGGLRNDIEMPAGYRIDSDDGVIVNGMINPAAFVPAIPEPASAWLTGLAGLALIRGRSRRRAV